VLDS